MHCISITKIFYYTLIFGLYGLQACTDTNVSGTSANSIEHRKSYTIDLFREQVTHDNTGKMKKPEAFANSLQVIRTAYVKQIGYSNERGVKPFYIYQVNQGKFEKSGKSDKIKFPVLFLSREKLFEGKVFQDSVDLFLGPLQQYEVLQFKAGIKYEWVEKAPFEPY